MAFLGLLGAAVLHAGMIDSGWAQPRTGPNFFTASPTASSTGALPQTLNQYTDPGNINWPSGFENIGQESIDKLTAAKTAPDIQNAINDVTQRITNARALNGGLNGLGSDGIKDIVTNLQKNLSLNTNGSAAELLQQVALNNMPGDLAKSLSTIKGLGDISGLDMGNLGDLTKGLQDALGKLNSVGELSKILNMKDLNGFLTAQGADMLAKALQVVGGQTINNFLKEAGIEALSNAIQQIVGKIPGLTELLKSLFGSNPKNLSKSSQDQPADEVCGSCCTCGAPITNNHIRIRGHMTSQMQLHRTWIVTQFFEMYNDDPEKPQGFLQALQLMTNQLSAIGYAQVGMIGAMFDAKHQMETQRLFQVLTARAHKDYQPSAEMCTFGTNMRGLISADRLATMGQAALAARMRQRQLLTGDNLAREGIDSDAESRFRHFAKTYCGKEDNGQFAAGGGLGLLCESTDPGRVNRDADFYSTVERNLTLEVDFTDAAMSEDEEDVMALSANLFANDVLPLIEATYLMTGNKPSENAERIMELRSIAARRAVAQNSFAAIAALRSAPTYGVNMAAEVAPFMRSILENLGVKPKDIDAYIGKNPSYLAQMEVLTKLLYQNPDFYTNLYDKPANVERIRTVIDAVGLIQDRDTYKSLIRGEAILATLIETMLRAEEEQVDNPRSTSSAEEGRQ